MLYKIPPSEKLVGETEEVVLVGSAAQCLLPPDGRSVTLWLLI